MHLRLHLPGAGAVRARGVGRGQIQGCSRLEHYYIGERDASLAAVAPANPRSSLLISRSEKRPDLPSSSMRRKDIVPPP